MFKKLIKKVGSVKKKIVSKKNKKKKESDINIDTLTESDPAGLNEEDFDSIFEYKIITLVDGHKPKKLKDLCLALMYLFNILTIRSEELLELNRVNSENSSLKRSPLIPKNYEVQGVEETQVFKIQDIERYHLESYLRSRQEGKVFFIEYQCQKQGSISGYIRLWTSQMTFTPYDDRHKGIYNYSDSNLEENTSFGFLLSYCDILSDQIELQIDKDSSPKKVTIRIPILNTGNYFFCENSVKHKYKTLKANNKYIASIKINIPLKNLNEQKLATTKRTKIAKELIKAISECCKNTAELDFDGFTSLPCFDINYGSIKFIQDQNKDEKSEGNLHEWASLIEEMFGYRNAIIDGGIKEENEDEEMEERDSFEDTSVIYSIDLTTENVRGSRILTESLENKLRECLPDYLATTEWNLKFSSSKHGKSFQTLQRNCREEELFMMLAKTTDSQIIGAYFTGPFKPSDDFFGSGESFLFTASSSIMVAYKSSLHNNYYCYCSKDGFGMGSDPKFGLYIKENLIDGVSSACRTFCNKPLISKEFFRMTMIEIWSVQP